MIALDWRNFIFWLTPCYTLSQTQVFTACKDNRATVFAKRRDVFVSFLNVG